MNLPESGGGFTYQNVECTWTIEGNGRATLEVRREVLFSREPAGEELYDIVFGTKELAFETLDYRSPDAEVTDVDASSNLVKVFWRPLHGIRVGEPYAHSYTCKLPDVLSPQYKEFTITTRAPTQRYHLEIVSRRPVQDVVCYKARRGQSWSDPREIFLQARRSGRRHAPPPKRIAEGRFEVTIKGVQPGDSYFAVVEFARPAAGAPRPRLVVIVPGIKGGLDAWQPLIERLGREEALVDTYWEGWDHGKRWHSFADAEQLARELRAHIDQVWLARGPFEDVVLVGHSMGGLLVRRAYMQASGVDPGAPQRAAWVARVSRLILFAGINRGVDTTSEEARWWIRLAAWLCRAIPFLRRWLVWDLLRGSTSTPAPC